jgi:predicted O-methyltransferase YrrM
MASPLNDEALESLLDRLHAASAAEMDEAMAYLGERAAAGTLNWTQFDDDLKTFFATRMVALDRDKAEFCYLTCRSLRAARVVEAGTSFGVSTLYLAAAVRDNGAPDAVVIATEHEPRKAAIARDNFAAAGLASFIELREGDLRETLRKLPGPIDFVLIDIWEVALPALRLVAPHLRPGAVVISDNTTAFPEYYRDYFAFVNDPANRLRTLTLPFEGGLEFTVRI